MAAADPFVVIAAGRCPFTTARLVALAIWWTGSARGGTTLRV